MFLDCSISNIPLLSLLRLQERCIMKIYISIAVIIFLIGCSSSPPDCADKSVKETVTELIDTKTQIGYALGMQVGVQLKANGIDPDPTKFGYKLDAIRTTGSDKKTNISRCAANIQILYDGKAYFEKPIGYTAQLTDNKKDVYVEIQ